MDREEKGRGCRVVLVPFPLQSHLYPMLQLGLALHNRGFSITVIYSTLFSPSPAQYPNFDLKPISDGSAELQATIDSPTDFDQVLNKSCEAPFRKHMLELVEGTGKDERIACIISDFFVHFTESTAVELGVPMFALWTSNLNSLVAMATDVLLRKADPTMRLDSYSEEDLEELPPLRKKDLIFIDTKDPAIEDAWYKLVDAAIKVAKQSSGLIFYTFEFLEQSEWISKFKQQFGSTPYFFPISPHNINDSSPLFHSSLKPNKDCIQWLDQQEHNKSVLYVSFGSTVSITKHQFFEIAHGLARSKLPFLWVLRQGMLIGEEHIELPDEIKQIVESKRGFVVDWAPQREVLAHRAVGGFWTHCGWNSVMESISAGVSMICTPWFAEQFVNARFVTQVWKIGIEMEKELTSEVIGKVIRRLMAEDEGEKMKQNVDTMREKALDYSVGGGPSFTTFVQSIMSTPP